MKIKHIIFFGAVVAFSSCSTAYRSGQTPDDVYYSPAPVQGSYASSANDDGYVSPENDNDQNSYYYRNNNDGQNYSGGMNQSYLAPVTLDLGFGYSPYGYGGLGYNPYYYNSFGNPFYSYNLYGMYNPYMYNSFGYSGLGFYNPYGFYDPYSFYNPYMYSPSFLGHYYPYSYYSVSGNSNIGLYSGPRRYNLNAYTNNGATNRSTGVGVRGSNSGYVPTSPAPIRRTSGVGNVIRRVFSPNSNNTYVSPSNNRSSNNSNNYRRNNNSENYRTFSNEQAPSRNYNNSPSVSAPSNSGSSSGSAPVRTFRR